MILTNEALFHIERIACDQCQQPNDFTLKASDPYCEVCGLIVFATKEDLFMASLRSSHAPILRFDDAEVLGNGKTAIN